MSDDLRELRSRLTTRAFGRAHEHHEVLASTNDRAVLWVEAPHGAVVTADAQTAGRGRRGRAWSSPPGQNIYASVVLRPEAVRRDFAAIGLAVAVGLADGLPVDVELKWPNDLLVGGRKLGGILCESRWLGARPDVVVGFGINVHQRVFEGDLAASATSLAACDAALPRALLLARLLSTLEEAVEGFVEYGFAAVRGAYEARCSMLGRRVEVAGVPGVFEALDEDGALLLRPATGGALQRIEVADSIIG